ncbi:ferredoxin family protein [Rhodopirellula sp. MGV]|uniref:4Fe-4S dicluster domain-containing protein n=1 Tax=Rhodopirellula sp. MGV TaxID=2023130 RepID=UPI000B96CBF9|nr:ferredoxin family protein [Rhodopirellula sp. MGV]OYP36981.1 Fe-S oxidoreductase [Rhodopirellula sp. MGV]PNY36256.1 ferredoxin family protein [Rhodopirellula baltica]
MISANVQPETSTNWTVVISKGQSRNPVKRSLEQALADAASKLDGVAVVVVPHLYDLPKGGESLTTLAEIDSNIIVASWIFPRAAHWVLDRNGVRGQFVAVDDDQDDDEEPSSASARDVDRVADLYPRPDREIHCIDLKNGEDPQRFIELLQQIVLAEQADHSAADRSLPIIGGKLVEVDETTARRWYPVIDFSRCTNCMECVDFCLFGVYGVDQAETILVEQPDNCRKGCPACSRVCPENAIIFPQHKAPAIAGADIGGDEGFKIDLSKLFGAPDGGEDAIATAARERDEQLLLTGRDAVGIDDQLKRRQRDVAQKPKDDLDKLIDSLDALDL